MSIIKTSKTASFKLFLQFSLLSSIYLSISNTSILLGLFAGKNHFLIPAGKKSGEPAKQCPHNNPIYLLKSANTSKKRSFMFKSPALSYIIF